jgi:hypothetical protein
MEGQEEREKTAVEWETLELNKLVKFKHLPVSYIQFTYLLTELSLSWEAVNCAAIQEIPSNFKEPEGSSPCSQELSTGPYPEPVWSSPYHPILSLDGNLSLCLTN